MIRSGVDQARSEHRQESSQRPTLNRIFSRRGTYGLDAEPREAAAVFDTIEKALQRTDRDFRDQAVLELGPGRSPELARLALARGASRYYAVDTRLQLTAAMFDEVDDHSVGLFEYNGRTIPLRTRSIDIIYSKSVLEHVRAGLVRPLLDDCRRVLRPGGTMVHVIDLRDHLHINGDHEVTGDWLEALQYSDGSFRCDVQQTFDLHQSSSGLRVAHSVLRRRLCCRRLGDTD